MEDVSVSLQGKFAAAGIELFGRLLDESRFALEDFIETARWDDWRRRTARPIGFGNPPPDFTFVNHDSRASEVSKMLIQ